MKSEAAICKAFDAVQARLSRHAITVHTNDVFGLKFNGDVIFVTDTVDGLTNFADALDFARGAT